MYKKSHLMQFLFLDEKNKILPQWKNCDKLIDRFGLIKIFVQKYVFVEESLSGKKSSICGYIWAKIFTLFKTKK